MTTITVSGITFNRLIWENLPALAARIPYACPKCGNKQCHHKAGLICTTCAKYIQNCKCGKEKLMAGWIWGGDGDLSPDVQLAYAWGD